MNASNTSYGKASSDVLRKTLLANRHITDSGCWEWMGCRINRATRDVAHTYGQIQTGKKVRELVHRVAFKVFVGEIPDGKIIMHTCDNGPCFNPEHLSVGTHLDNRVDAIEKGRFSGRGKTNPLWFIAVGHSAHFRKRPTGTTFIARKRGVYFSVLESPDGFTVYALPEKPAPVTMQFPKISQLLNMANGSEAWQILRNEKQANGSPYCATVLAALKFWAEHRNGSAKQAA